jgi:hypothetical protein
MPTSSFIKNAGAIDFLLEGGNAGTDQWAIALFLFLLTGCPND